MRSMIIKMPVIPQDRIVDMIQSEQMFQSPRRPVLCCLNMMDLGGYEINHSSTSSRGEKVLENKGHASSKVTAIVVVQLHVSWWCIVGSAVAFVRS